MTPARALTADALGRALLGSTAVARDLTEADAALRRPVSTSRRVAVVGVGGGSGTTTVTGLVAGLLARRRGRGVLAVDAARGDGGLAAVLGVGDPLPLHRSLGRTAGVVTAAAAREALPQAVSGASVLGAGSARGDDGVTPPAWRAAVDPVGRFFDVVLTDWGVRGAGRDGGHRDLADAVDAHHAVLLVARADRPHVEAALGLLADLAPHLPAGAGTGLVLVDIGGTAGPTDDLARRALGALDLPVAVHTVPHDDVLGRGAWATPARADRARVRRRDAVGAGRAPLALPTRRAVASLAAGALELAVRA